MQIFAMTGAGISAPSGIPTFRDSGALWSKHDLSEVATRDALVRDPDKVNRFFSDLWSEYRDKVPNEAHIALKKLEAVRDVTIATQNVDNLHEKAGSKTVYHAHGTLDKVIDHNGFEVGRDHCENPARPNVVLFGEETKFNSEILLAAKQSDELWIIGTEGVVWPFMGYASAARRSAKSQKRDFTIRFFNERLTDFEVSFSRTFTPRERSFSYHGDVSKTLPEIVEKIINVKKGCFF